MRGNDAWVIHAGAIGDFVLTLSIVQALRRGGVDSIRILGHRHYANIAETADGIDALDCLDAPPWHQLFGETPTDAIRAVEARGVPRLIVDMLGISSAATSALTSIGVTSMVRLDPRPRPDARDHITQQWADSLRHHGIRIAIEPPRLDVSAPRGPHEGAIVHVGAGGRSKCWQIANWVKCAKQLQAAGVHVTFLLGPAELELSAAAKWHESLDQVGTILEAPSFPELKRRLRHTAVFLGNDSGITHLAAAMMTPTVAVFGGTDPAVWHPLGPNVTTLGQSMAWPGVSAVVNAARARLSLNRQDDA